MHASFKQMQSEITAVGSLTKGDKSYGHTDDRVNENYAIKKKTWVD